jgi:predicted AlkP superfamily pyrophosphatase or phosphodiesterase
MYYGTMKRKPFPLLLCALLLTLGQTGWAQKATSPKAAVAENKKMAARPRLVVGIVVDQMRWDYLYRYANRYGDGGFKRLLREGFSCENTLINYTPTVTACGHTCVYTGSVPAVHGILGNEWYSRELDRDIYCAEDSTVTTVGSTSDAGKMSPRNLKVTTIGDELRLSDNFESKVVGIAIKDRGAILPAGHTANAAYWYDPGAGNWVTSTYYMKTLPAWAQDYNNQHRPASFLAQPWTTLYPIETYLQSLPDSQPFEGAFKGEPAPVFPHDLKATPEKSIASTPFGNTMTLEFAEKALDAYQLGKGNVTDMLAISLSSTDYVGHQFGPNSIEIEDTYLRLDKDLAAFFKYLDEKIGKGQYICFITADHGVAHVPGFAQSHDLPGGTWSEGAAVRKINEAVKQQFGIERVVLHSSNHQLYINHDAVSKAGKSEKDIREFITALLMKDPLVTNVIYLPELFYTTLPEPLRTMLANGYNAKSGGDLQIILQSGYIDGGKTGTSHSVWYPYDAHIPLVWMGWGINPGQTNHTVGMTDIAPTLAALLHIQMPSGNVGHAIEAITK